MSSKKMIIQAISTVIAMGLTSTSMANDSNSSMKTNDDGNRMMEGPAIQGMERCFGIAKAGRNDCGNAMHTCSGEAKTDGDKNEWLFVPTGLCNRIVGGSTKPPTKS